jgi:hypothetical protein
MTNRYIKLLHTQPINQERLKKLETMMETIWTPNSFCFYFVTFSNDNILCVDYPTDLTRSQAISQLESMDLQIDTQ